MSFVIAVMRPGYSVLAGDTQLNDDNGETPIKGIKVFAVDNSTVVGFTGNYKEGRHVMDKFLSMYDVKKEFDEKALLLSGILKGYCKKGNVILVETKLGKTQYAIYSDDFGWGCRKKTVTQPEVIPLLPPGFPEKEGYEFDSSSNYRHQAIDSVKWVSQRSKFVNGIVYGTEMDGQTVSHFTDGIDISDVIRTKGLWIKVAGRIVAYDVDKLQ